MSPIRTKFYQTPLGTEFILSLQLELQLNVSAAYLVKNGKDCEILHLYVNRETSDKRWHSLLNECWLTGDEHAQIRDILFSVMRRHSLTPPTETRTDYGGNIYENCFHIALIDLKYWQTYWQSHTR